MPNSGKIGWYTSPVATFLTEREPDELIAMMEERGYGCIVCQSPQIVGLSAYNVAPEERPFFTGQGQDPEQTGSIFSPLCPTCANEGAAQDEILNSLRLHVARTKGLAK